MVGRACWCSSSTNWCYWCRSCCSPEELGWSKTHFYGCWDIASVCAAAGGAEGVLETLSGHNSPWERLLELVQLLWELHPDPGTWTWLQCLPVGTGVAIPKLFLCVWILCAEICSLLLFNLGSSLVEKGLGLYQSFLLARARSQLLPEWEKETGLTHSRRSQGMETAPDFAQLGELQLPVQRFPLTKREGAEEEH